MDKELALHVALRVALGIVFLWGGIRKMFLGAPIPVGKIITFMASGNVLYVLGLIEFLIGLFLLLGLATRTAGWAAVGFAFLGLILALPAGMGFLAEEIVLIAVALVLAFRGSISLGLDNIFAKKM